MKRNRILIGLLVALVLTLSAVVFAQVNRPYRNGTVWNISFIRMKPGMETAYLNYIAGDWKREQEALKKDGQIISYKVVQTEAHGSTDFNLMLMTEYKDLATYEKNLEKAVLLVIFLSILPIIIEVVRSQMGSKKTPAEPESTSL